MILSFMIFFWNSNTFLQNPNVSSIVKDFDGDFSAPHFILHENHVCNHEHARRMAQASIFSAFNGSSDYNFTQIDRLDFLSQWNKVSRCIGMVAEQIRSDLIWSILYKSEHIRSRWSDLITPVQSYHVYSWHNIAQTKIGDILGARVSFVRRAKVLNSYVK